MKKTQQKIVIRKYIEMALPSIQLKSIKISGNAF